MALKTIGIDLDETLVKLYPVFKKIFKKNKMKYIPFKTLSAEGRTEKIKLGIQEAFKNPEIMCGLKSYPFVVEKLLYLKIVKKYKLIIITARYDSVKQQTMQWLNKRFPMVDEVIITPPQFKIKRDVLIKNKVDLWIDDNPIEIADIMNYIPCIMISNKNTLYNHHLRNKVQFVHYFFQINPNTFIK